MATHIISCHIWMCPVHLCVTPTNSLWFSDSAKHIHTVCRGLFIIWSEVASNRTYVHCSFVAGIRRSNIIDKCTQHFFGSSSLFCSAVLSCLCIVASVVRCSFCLFFVSFSILLFWYAAFLSADILDEYTDFLLLLCSIYWCTSTRQLVQWAWAKCDYGSHTSVGSNVCDYTLYIFFLFSSSFSNISVQFHAKS